MVTNKTPNLPTKTEIEAWFVTYFADLLSLKPDDIDITIPFDRYGLDSSAVVVMTGDLEDWLAGIEIDPTLMYDYPTIELLAEYLSQLA